VTEPIHLGPGSDLPGWLEALDLACFGLGWGGLEDQEHVWALPAQAFARWRVVPAIGEAELLRLAVAPEARGRGLGSSLLRACEERLGAMGCTLLRLEVRTSNHPARALYASLGWKEVGLRPGYYRDGEDAVLYDKS
jgi:ribosomal protein S18 acetylase RimI-like enzyme